jgi:DNA-binding LacI/PurR family transcriptional regulator
VPKAAQRDMPLAEKVIGRLREEIGAGRMEPGRYLPSERELCRQFSVSRFTVRSALGSLVAEGLLERRPSRGYLVRGAGEGAMNGGSRGSLMFVHAHPEGELLSGYHARMWAGARLEAARLGSRIVITSVHGEKATRAKAEEIGRISAGVMCDSDDEEWVDALLAAGLKVVRIDHLAVRADAPRLNTVIQDDYQGISQLLEHLYSRGHRRVGLLDFCRAFDPRRRGHSARRLGAYVGECRRLGIAEDRDLIAEVRAEEVAGSGPTLSLLDAGATALIASHGFLLPGARAGLVERKLEIGADFGLVVYGEPAGNGDAEDYPTHVAWSKERMGQEAVRRLFAALENPDEAPLMLKVPTELIDRDTGGSGPEA